MAARPRLVFFPSYFCGRGQWHYYLKLIMPSAKAAISSAAFVAVDHWRGAPSSFFFLLSALGASAPLWQRADLDSASSSPSKMSFGCVCAGVWEWWKERVCPWLCARTSVCAGSSGWFIHVCVGTCVCVRSCTCRPSGGLCLCSTQSQLMAYRSRNTFISFNTISKPQHSLPDFLNDLPNPCWVLHWELRKELYNCNVFVKVFCWN